MGPKSKNNSKNNKKNNQSKSYLADDDNYQSFSNQLLKLGLQLRDITGDGNCLFRYYVCQILKTKFFNNSSKFFRALSDQMEGDETHHLEYRKKVCIYMRQNREEFEPFIGFIFIL
jgi:OTU domain-containing protein 3